MSCPIDKEQIDAFPRLLKERVVRQPSLREGPEDVAQILPSQILDIRKSGLQVGVRTMHCFTRVLKGFARPQETHHVGHHVPREHPPRWKAQGVGIAVDKEIERRGLNCAACFPSKVSIPHVPA